MRREDPRDLLVDIADILKRLRIPYVITGGMAVLVWGRPRFTADIDVIVELHQRQVDELVRALLTLGEKGYIDKNAIQEALSRKGEFNFIDGETGIKVDFWVVKDNFYDVSRLKRRKIKKVLDQNIYFVSPEDLILSKLQWYEQSQSSRHLEDAKSVLEVSVRKLDMKYLKKWAKKLGISKTLGKLIKTK